MKNFKLILIFIISSVLIIFLSFNINKLKEPKDVYRVYLDGEVIGLIKSKEKLESYIDKEQKEIKKRYGVNKVYVPNSLEINKYVTYNEKISSSEKIYNKIKDQEPFTIDGYVATLKKDNKKQYIYMLDIAFFDKAIDKIVRTFLNPDRYDLFLEEEQKEIKDTGILIENVYIEEMPTIKRLRISTDETIFTNEEDLIKFMLFGTLEHQGTYTVLEGETIDEVAFKNGLGSVEFLIANPNFTSTKNLLFKGQEVNIGLINPQITIVVDQEEVEDQEIPFRTENQYDYTMYQGYSEVLQEGEAGLDRVTKKIQYKNGIITQVVTPKSVSLKPAIDKIIVYGGKQSSWGGSGAIGDWYWPTVFPYTLSSPFGYRGGVLHNGVDISGCGYGSPIYAAEYGMIMVANYQGRYGYHIVIDHGNGYYTLYAHLSKINVSAGQIVSRGFIIGTMGNSGNSTGTHLHFSITIGGPPDRGGTFVNPCPYIGC